MDITLNVRSKADNSVQESKLPADGRALLGRGPDCVVLLDGQGISREHLAVEAEDSAIYITDLSSNGTWLNGKRLAQNGRSKVDIGALIEVPGYEIRIRTSVMPVQEISAVGQGDDLPAVAAESSLSTSFTLLERFAAVTFLASAALLIFYIVS